MTAAFVYQTREAAPDARAIGNGQRSIHGCFHRPHYRLRERLMLDILVSLSTHAEESERDLPPAWTAEWPR